MNRFINYINKQTKYIEYYAGFLPKVYFIVLDYQYDIYN